MAELPKLTIGRKHQTSERATIARHVAMVKLAESIAEDWAVYGTEGCFVLRMAADIIRKGQRQYS